MMLTMIVLDVDGANISYEEARSLTTEINQINRPSENSTSLVAGIQILPGLLDGLILIDVTPKSYTVKDIWTAYVLGVISFDMVRHACSEIYRCYIDVKIRGNSYIITVASPDLEGIPYSLTNISISDKSIPAYYDVINELINEQLASNNPMKEAGDYQRSIT
ncbi:Uncharacterised protein [uncultured archaeon]|nr:Uncharacterised protein [uncultured archaeon]